ncbi:4810_t:CDS:1, partial [Funneliformis mosseae]
MADIEEIIDLYAEIPSFHEKYSGLLKQLPPSIINEVWKRLTTRKRNSLSAIDASYEDP